MWHLFCSKTQISRPLWFCFSSLGRPLYVTLYCGLLCEMAWRHNSIKQTCSIHSKNKDENLHFFMKEWCRFTFQGWVGKKLVYLNSWDQICKYLLNGIRRQTTPFPTMSVRQTCWQHRWLCSGTVYISRCRGSCWVTRSINVTSNWFWDCLCILQPLIFSYRLHTFGGNFNYSEYLTESAVTKFKEVNLMRGKVQLLLLTVCESKVINVYVSFMGSFFWIALFFLQSLSLKFAQWPNSVVCTLV